MTMLNRKLVRDLVRMWLQSLAIALVMACGVATLILSMGAYRSLEETRSAFYDRYRFATIFASAVRAPVSLRERIARIDGVSGVELRIVKAVLLDMPGMAEPATGFAISIPDRGDPAVNRLYLRAGRMPEPGRAGEVAVVETFAKAHRMTPGSTFSAILNGRKRTLTVTGIVLSPEYVYAIGPGDMVPDQRRFGVLFMPRSRLAGLFDMEGVFNDAVLRTQRGAETQAVIDRIDTVLKPYGGTGAHDRETQISNAFLDSELTQLKSMAFVIPPIFLFVSAFLVNMILSRLIALEREQIGLMKAVGYGEMAIAWHYSKLVLAIAIVGVVIGGFVGDWLGTSLTKIYGQFYSFPFLIFRQSFDLYVISAGITAAAALAGGARAIWSVVGLPAAVAMLPPAPTRYRTFFAGGSSLLRVFSQLTVMALRHLVRWPMRTALTTLGTSLSVALLVTALFSYDSIDFMIETVFYKAERQDATLSFGAEKAPGALLMVARLPGVMRAEPFRTEPVVLRNGYREVRTGIDGLVDGADLARVLDKDLNPVDAPPAGLMMSQYMADKLRLRIGDYAQVELTQREGREVMVPVTNIIESYVGLTAYMRADVLDRLIGNGPRISGARVSIDPTLLDRFYRTVKGTPAIAAIALQQVSLQKFRETIEANISTSMGIYVMLAVIITFGVIYNSARIQFSERARELASLRVLGFSRAEVSSVLLIELGAVALLAQPLGWLLGYLFSMALVKGFESDLFRIPFIINPSTYTISSIIVLAVALFSALVVRRRVDRLDLVRTLKTRE